MSAPNFINKTHKIIYQTAYYPKDPTVYNATDTSDDQSALAAAIQTDFEKYDKQM